MAVSDWSTTAADNASKPGINFAEGQSPGSLNDSARQMMADLKAWYDANAAAITAIEADGWVTSAKVNNDAITYAKIQNISSNQRVLGRTSGGSGNAEELTATQVLDWLSNTQGQILYRSASGWLGLPPGTAGTALVSGGAGGNPSYGVVPSPLPTSSGVGHWSAVSTGVGSNFTLPAGGTWAYSAGRFSFSTGVNSGSQTGIAAGGTIINSGTAGDVWLGFAWRIA